MRTLREGWVRWRPGEGGSGAGEECSGAGAGYGLGDEGGQRLVQRRELFADVIRDPGVVVPSAVGNVDHADAGFHEAAGKEEAATSGR